MISKPSMIKKLLSWESTIGILIQAVIDELDSLCTQKFLSLSKFRLLIDNSLVDFILCLSDEWSIAGQHDIDDATQRPNVNFWIILLSKNNFGSYIERTSKNLSQAVSLLKLARKSEVCDFNNDIVFIVSFC